jgi:hypothetical protein
MQPLQVPEFLSALVAHHGLSTETDFIRLPLVLIPSQIHIPRFALLQEIHIQFKAILSDLQVRQAPEPIQ